VILAAAGLRRLGMHDRIAEYLDVERFCPAPAQGILALQCRDDDERMRALVGVLADPVTTTCAAAERAFLQRLEASCTVPVGCFAELRADDVLCVTGLVIDPQGRPCFSARKMGAPSEAAELGIRLADNLLELGAGQVIDACTAARAG
jgi:hydroxymethylbilane synthase